MRKIMSLFICGLILPLAIYGQAPAVKQGPESRALCLGDLVTLRVSVLGDSLAFQWQKDGVDIPSETDSAIIFSILRSSQAGNYRCIVSNAYGADTSAAATLLVQQAPVIVEHPDDFSICTGDQVTLGINASGDDLHYQWQKNSQALLNETNAQLIINAYALADSGFYNCVVSNICDTLKSLSGKLHSSNTVITTQPISKSVCEGEAVLLSLKASGWMPSYQWQKNGTDIADAMQSSYIVIQTDTNDGGMYRCVTNACAAPISQEAVLTIRQKPRFVKSPGSQNLCDGDSMRLTAALTGFKPMTYKWYQNSTLLGQESENTLYIDSVSAAVVGYYSVQATNLCGSKTSQPATISMDLPVVTVQPIDQLACPGSDVIFSIQTSGSGLLYQWRHNGTDLEEGYSKYLGLPVVSAADTGTYVCYVSNLCSTIPSSSARLDFNIPMFTKEPKSEVSVCQNSDVLLSVTVKGNGVSYQWQKDGVHISGATKYSHLIKAVGYTDTAMYRCIAANSCGADTTVGTRVSINKVSIVQHPQSFVEKCIGDTMMFTLDARGNNLIYQWYKWNTKLEHGNKSTFTIPGIRQSDYGQYKCKVSNSCDSKESLPGELAIYPVTAIAKNPTTINRYIGDTVTFLTTANGVNLEYQWIVEGTFQENTNSTTYTINGIGLEDAGEYQCYVTGECGNVLSTVAILHVLDTADNSVADYLASEGVRIYPSPAQQHVYVELADHRDRGVLSVISMTGQPVVRQEVNAQALVKLDLHALAGGIYLVKYQSDLYTVVKKVMLER